MTQKESGKNGAREFQPLAHLDDAGPKIPDRFILLFRSNNKHCSNRNICHILNIKSVYFVLIKGHPEMQEWLFWLIAEDADGLRNLSQGWHYRVAGKATA